MALGGVFIVGAVIKSDVERFAGEFDVFDPEMNKLKFTRRGMPNLITRKKTIIIPKMLKNKFLFDWFSSLLDNLDLEIDFLILRLSSVRNVSRWEELNLRPNVYETFALPLSYIGEAEFDSAWDYCMKFLSIRQIQTIFNTLEI